MPKRKYVQNISQVSENPIPLTLPITTRGIGMATIEMYKMCSSIDYKKRLPLPDINDFFRLSLSLLENKLKLVQLRNGPISDEIYDFTRFCQQYIITSYGTLTFFEPITKIINAIGRVKYRGKIYIPALSANSYTSNGKFIPRPENIVLSNLRETVTALADPDVDIQHRKFFFEHNSIPGADWDPETFLLLNPDHIMPADYNHISNEIEIRLDTIFCLLENIYKKKISAEIEWEGEGKNSLLVSNDLENLRIPNFYEYRNRELRDCSISLNGNVESFRSLEKLRGAEILEGRVNLLGECPSFSSENPFYYLRSTRANPFESDGDYKRSLLKLYS